MQRVNTLNIAPPNQTAELRHIRPMRKVFCVVMVVGGLTVPHISAETKPAESSARGTGLVLVTKPVVYADVRPYPAYRLDAVDQGKLFCKWDKEQDNFQRFNIAENGPGIGLQIRVTDLDSNGWKDIVCAGKSGTHNFWNDGK